MDKRFIIVGFHEGIGHTLQVGGVMAWCFMRRIKAYKNFQRAINQAHKVNTKFKCDRICVYEIGIEERVSCSFFSRWEDKIKFEINNK